MVEPADPLQQFWDDLLSEEPERTRAAFSSLDAETKTAVISHLKSMVSEEGWHPSQIRAARAALEALSGEEA